MRCPRCGNENPASNRFCGMCGTSLLVEPVESRVQATRAETQVREPIMAAREESRAAAPEADEAPIITGSSFLGLDQPAPSAKKRASLSVDPHAPSSRDLDYLLEDEEHSHRSGMWTRILIVVALALAVGLGYLRWKHQGLPWLRASGSSKPAASAPAETGTDSGAGTAVSPAPSNPESVPAAAPSQTTPVPTPQTGSEPAVPGGTQATAPVSTTPAPASSAGETATPAGGASSDTTPALAAQRPPEHRPADEEEDPNVTTAVRPTPTHASKPAEDSRATKPRPEPPTATPARAADSVAEAQKYLYGKGAKQDCERGLRLLKPAAAESNPRAMVEMGALYSAGLCTPRDLPTAYRWFAMALRKQPENQALHADLQKLWGEMTQPERQLAIKLTQ